MSLSRRGILTGLIAAPAVILTPGLLMPVKPVIWAPPRLTPASEDEVVVRFLDAETNQVLSEHVARPQHPTVFTAWRRQTVRAEIEGFHGKIDVVDFIGGKSFSLFDNDSLSVALEPMTSRMI